MELLTFDELFDTVVKEKSEEELQPLALDFFERVKAYVSSKQATIRISATDPFSLQKKEQAIHQMKNIKRLLRELYDRRERKIVSMALVRVRTGSPAFDVSVLSEGEKALFENIVQILTTARDKSSEERAEAVPMTEALKEVVFVQDMTAFMGKDMQTYGPFNQNDITELPASLADALIEKGKVKQA